MTSNLATLKETLLEIKAVGAEVQELRTELHQSMQAVCKAIVSSIETQNSLAGGKSFNANGTSAVAKFLDKFNGLLSWLCKGDKNQADLFTTLQAALKEPASHLGVEIKEGANRIIAALKTFENAFRSQRRDPPGDL